MRLTNHLWLIISGTVWISLFKIIIKATKKRQSYDRWISVWLSWDWPSICKLKLDKMENLGAVVQRKQEERTKEYIKQQRGKQKTGQLHKHTHLEHLEDLEEACVWEEGTVADRHAVPTPESHREDETGLIFWWEFRRHWQVSANQVCVCLY